ncbi:helix-turn-helix transcriptional regulator [Leucobacter sp. USHLN153]|uniref:helix-turn-helix transcriptional regulator n=1 Tax=Leucobacter sp. USHLN153 TaxID=3081268 RepID=UPI00301A52B8
MRKALLAPDRVTFLLALVAYLRESGPATVTELSERFGVQPPLVRTLVRFLGTAGVPGETLSYQDEDLFDIDWEALEQHDLVSLTRTVAVEEAPRFSPLETAALIAGLQALTPMLGADDAELARRTAAKLGGSLGASGAVGVSLPEREADPRLPWLIEAVEADRSVAFTYRDASGAESRRRVRADSLSQRDGSWYLRGYCWDRAADRTFRVDQMSELGWAEAAPCDARGVAGEPAPSEAHAPRADTSGTSSATSTSGHDGRSLDIVALATRRALPRLGAFDPEILGEEADGRVRLRVEAWHPGASVQIVQVLPGEIEIVSPEGARASVREWSARALAAYGW